MLIEAEVNLNDDESDDDESDNNSDYIDDNNNGDDDDNDDDDGNDDEREKLEIHDIMDLENNFFLEKDNGFSEMDIELENSDSYNDNNDSDYDPLELVQESMNEELFTEIINEEAFQQSEETQQLLNDSTVSEEDCEINNGCEATILHTYSIKQHNLRRKKNG